MCGRALLFWEFVHLERVKSKPDWESATPRDDLRPRTETDWNVDWCHTKLRIMAHQYFSCSRVVCYSSKTEWKGGGGSQGHATTRFFYKTCQNGHQNISFFDILSDVPKDLEDISAGIGIFLKISYIKILLRIWCQSWQGQVWPPLVQLGFIQHLLREILHIHEQFWQPDESLCSILWLHQSETRLAMLVLFGHLGTPTFV